MTTNPFIEALQRIQSLTAEWPGDIEAARVIGTVNAIAYVALLMVVPEGAKITEECRLASRRHNKQETDQ
jgi:hypothetical protein